MREVYWIGDRFIVEQKSRRKDRGVEEGIELSMIEREVRGSVYVVV